MEAKITPVGEGDYVVRQGDALESIAESRGHFWETIWMAPENADLRDARGNPHVLLPGDRLHIPELRRREETGATEQRHRFRRKGVPSKLRVVLEDEDGPRSGLSYTLEIEDGTIHEGHTDGDGAIEHPIPPGVKRAILVVGDPPEHYELKLAHLDPVESVSGQQARLANLGLYARKIDGKQGAALASALRMFQESHDLEISGEADQATRDKLVEVHGS
jgi:N-acetylmuramoyl-L-alanine amidase